MVGSCGTWNTDEPGLGRPKALPSSVPCRASVIWMVLSGWHMPVNVQRPHTQRLAVSYAAAWPRAISTNPPLSHSAADLCASPSAEHPAGARVLSSLSSLLVLSCFCPVLLSLMPAKLAHAFHLQSIPIELFMKGKWQLVHNFQGWSISTCTGSTHPWISHLLKNSYPGFILSSTAHTWL